MEKETDPGHSWGPHITAAAVIYSSLSPHPRQRGHLVFPLNPPVLQHLDLMDTGNVLIYYKLDLGCSGTKPGPFPGE